MVASLRYATDENALMEPRLNAFPDNHELLSHKHVATGKPQVTLTALTTLFKTTAGGLKIEQNE